ncbi:uncharacterized protein LOC116849885 [Odontomachus brunneus]|uniref:uncharacterized protein LOC116849885 n=1 Tax=Odontomachus brunneus TaxID=486640 RepID=UPI0013F25B7E|nr:uncharacterized protein LOC116849885 [Odontomachus brunneus]
MFLGSLITNLHSELPYRIKILNKSQKIVHRFIGLGFMDLRFGVYGFGVYGFGVSLLTACPPGHLPACLSAFPPTACSPDCLCACLPKGTHANLAPRIVRGEGTHANLRQVVQYHDPSSSSNLTSYVRSILPGNAAPWFSYLGGTSHPVLRLHLQDSWEKNRDANVGNVISNSLKLQSFHSSLLNLLQFL